MMEDVEKIEFEREIIQKMVIDKYGDYLYRQRSQWRENQKRYLDNHPEAREKMNEYNKEYRSTHRQYFRDYMKEYYKKKKEKMSAAREYEKSLKEKN